jgi:hypothetical protein
MKLCSRCQFIYEDDQECCDMDGAELVYEPTLQGGSQTTTLESALSALRTPKPASPRIPLSNSPQAETFTAPPAVFAFAASKSLRLPMAAGVFLVVLVFVAYYAAPALFSTTPQASANSVETQNPNPQSVPAAGKDGDNNSSSSPASDQSPSPESPSSSPSSQAPTNSAAPSSSLNPEVYQVASTTEPLSARNLRTAHATGRTRSASDNRLTIPRLAQVTTLPRVPPLRSLPPANPEKKNLGSASADAREYVTQREVIQRPAVIQNENQKLAVAGAKPASYRPAGADEKKQSRFGSFLKKTGRILSKPFRDKL